MHLILLDWKEKTGCTLLGSSMAEHSAVNRRVVGSSPTRAAILLGSLVGKIPELTRSQRFKTFLNSQVELGTTQTRNDSKGNNKQSIF